MRFRCLCPGFWPLRVALVGKEYDMPIYEFRCSKCGLVQERLLMRMRWLDAPAICPPFPKGPRRSR